MTSTPTRFIGICGYKQAGKDTAASALVAHLGYTRFALADPLKEMALDIDPICPDGWLLTDFVGVVGWDEAKQHPDVRRFLQRLGTEGCRKTFGDDVWIDLLLRNTAATPKVVVPDVRFPNELSRLAQEGALLLWIQRPGAEASAHASESSLAPHMAHVVIHNDGTIEEFQKKVLDAARDWE